MDANDLVTRAARLAARAHHGQFRRDGVTPYVRHPEAVASRVSGDPMCEAVAWLHDVFEDTAVTAEEMRERGIPDEVIACVRLLTKAEGVDYDAYLAAVKQNAVAKRVKIADMLSNLSDHPSERQIVKYAKGLLILLS